jgi:hypothetical protein
MLTKRKKIRWTGSGLVKKGHHQFKQLDERICVLFLLNFKSKDVHLILAQILNVHCMTLPFLLPFQKGLGKIRLVFCLPPLYSNTLPYRN